MDRKATAKETLKIMERGSYEINGKTVDISKMHAASIDNSLLFTPRQRKFWRSIRRRIPAFFQK